MFRASNIKLFLSILLLQPMLTYAWIPDKCTNLKLRIENKTQTSCYLLDVHLISGTVLDATDIPTFIFPGETTHWFQLSENAYSTTDYFGDPVHVILKYDCEQGKTVTFLSEKTKCRRSSAEVNALVLAESNMNTSFTLSDGIMRDNTAGTIVWTFSEKKSLAD